MEFMQALRHRWSNADSLVCVGLDPEPAKFPARFGSDPDAVFAFCRAIVDATAGHACAFKPQDRKSTRLNSSHVKISYAVFCLKKKKKEKPDASGHSRE